MVGKRAWATANSASQENNIPNRRKIKRALTEAPSTRDEQSGLIQFTDAADLALEEARRDELKDRLLRAVDRENLEKFRKTDEEVGLLLSWYLGLLHANMVMLAQRN
jgi:hypothetical protein